MRKIGLADKRAAQAEPRNTVFPHHALHDLGAAVSPRKQHGNFDFARKPFRIPSEIRLAAEIFRPACTPRAAHLDRRGARCSKQLRRSNAFAFRKTAFDAVGAVELDQNGIIEADLSANRLDGLDDNA